MEMETLMGEGEDMPEDTAMENEEDISQLCRTCANPNEYLIPIFLGEGLEHELKDKLSKHLSIKISVTDNLPTQLCYQCASTLIAWHDLVIGCIEADKKLNALFQKRETSESASGVGEKSRKVHPTENDTVPRSPSSASKRIETTFKSEEEATNQPMGSGNEVETEKIVVFEEEVTTMEPGTEEQVSTDLRYTLSACHETVKLLNPNDWGSNNPLYCILCGMVMQNKELLVRHQSTCHNVEFNHLEGYPTNGDYLPAEITLNDNRFSSTIDNIPFKNKTAKHKTNIFHSETHRTVLNTKESPLVKIHSPRKKVQNKRIFKCDQCLASFSRIYDLKRHGLRIHYNNSSVVGWKVNKDAKFISNKIVRNTPSKKRLIKSIPEIQCDKCVTSFVRVNDLKQHKLRYHSFNSTEVKDGKGSDGSKSINNKSMKYISCKTGMDINKKSVINNETNFINNSNGDFDKSEGISQYLDVNIAPSKKPSTVRKNKNTYTVQVGKKQSSGQGNFNDKPFPCNSCDSDYATRANLQRHMIARHGGAEPPSQCVVLIDDGDIEVVKRAKQVVCGITVFHCDECKKNLHSKESFIRHIRVHKGEKPFVCYICGNQFRLQKDVARHLRVVHEKVKNHPCDICGQYFADIVTRDDHRRTHTGERPFLCFTCGKSFPSRSSIYIHHRIHTNYFPHHCRYCEQKFRTQQRLLEHTRIHTGEKPFACDICSKRFRVKNEVSRHRLIHSNEKPYECCVCGVCFAQKRYLISHKKTHHLTALDI